MTPTLSVVVPALDEAAAVGPLLRALDADLGPGDEVLLVDGGSADGTADLARALGLPRVHVLAAPRGRARQMNAGAARAVGDWLVFLHADGRLPRPAIEAVRAATGEWGYFGVRLDAPGLAFRAVEAGINLRSRAFDTPSGDQALFVRRATFEALGGYRDVPLMEDLLLADALRARGAPGRPGVRVTTSARRWRARGLARTVAGMWALRAAFRLGVPPERLAPRYPASR
ncbi:MAG: TIGR04283 family arsenosugar biosynthesis glycosyltransferase [Planctomycetes bacterium]|nr:TIGR04283 family arsenosugar biosynthesis glycosyltransferase [Planctomycetota bacterium]